MTNTSHRKFEREICDRYSFITVNFNERDNKEIPLHTIDYVKSTKSFERPLIDQ